MREKLFSVTLNDCEVQTFSVGGHGGAGKDTSNSGVRIVHPPSGAVGEGREHRSQRQNKVAAIHRMAESPKFKSWVRLEAARRASGKTVDQLVDEAMVPANLKVEARVDGEWTSISSLDSTVK